MYQIQYSRSEIFECEYCMELILTGTIKLGKEKVNFSSILFQNYSLKNIDLQMVSP
jgi:hypothetical protein